MSSWAENEITLCVCCNLSFSVSCCGSSACTVSRQLSHLHVESLWRRSESMKPMLWMSFTAPPNENKKGKSEWLSGCCSQSKGQNILLVLRLLVWLHHNTHSPRAVSVFFSPATFGSSGPVSLMPQTSSFLCSVAAGAVRSTYWHIKPKCMKLPLKKYKCYRTNTSQSDADLRRVISEKLGAKANVVKTSETGPWSRTHDWRLKVQLRRSMLL